MRAIYLNPITKQVTDRAQVHHLASVLRLKPDEAIYVFDGTGVYYQARVVEVQKKNIELDLGDKFIYQQKHNIELALAWVKKDALETALNSAVQLGISKVHLFKCEFSQKVADLSKERFRKILISAAEQSNNFIIPTLVEHDSIDSLHNLGKWDHHFCFSLKSEASSKFLTKAYDRVLYWIGPEGGFSFSEIELFSSKGVNFFHLPVPIMRAPVAVSCALGYILGNQVKDIN